MYTDTPRGVRPYGRTGAASLAALSVLATGTAVLATPSAAFAAPTATLSRHADKSTVFGSVVDKSTALRGPSVKMTARFVRATYSELAADTTLVKKGDQVVFMGKLTFGRDGLPVQSHPVRLESSTSDGSWSTVESGLVGPDGTVSFVVTPSATATYRLSYSGVRPLGASVSPEQTVTVKLPPPPPVVRTTTTTRTTPSSSWGWAAGVSTIGSAGVPASGAGAAVVQAAAAQSGKPYVFGASGPNAFDCSGLTMFVYAQFGVYLPHLADAQKNYGVPVSAAEAAPGDLIAFLDGGYSGHIGIYAGGGMMYDAPNSRSTVGLHQIYSSNVVFRRLV